MAQVIPITHAPGKNAEAPRARVDPEQLLRRLEWTVMRRLDGVLQGDYRTLLRGFGIDLADLREYQTHDDVRYIDWNVTARMQTPYVREFLEDREVTAWFLLDMSGSINFGSSQVRKRELSCEFVAVLARLLTRHGNRVGALIYPGSNASSNDALPDKHRCEVIPARIGRRQVLHVLDRMQQSGDAAASSKNAAAKKGETNLATLLAQAQSIIKRRSVVFLVSDFLSVPGWDKAIELLSRRHEVIGVRLYDPMELELPNLGFVVMQDAETGEQLFVDTRDSRFRKRFAEAAARRETALRDALAHAGIDCLELATDDGLGDALLRFIQLRKRRSQLAAGAMAAHRALTV